MSKNAVKVLYRLHNAGYEAYLVGGAVRDLLLGHRPKDFDIATDAKPEEVKRLFRNCRLIGRRFRLAHVFFGREIIEVATFRGGEPAENSDHQSDEGMILRDNVYGTLEEDALRRDFTVNALYYNIADFSIVDYWGGVSDLEGGLLRLLGDPQTRYREDPVRMLRAARFAAKLDFEIAGETAEPIFELGGLLDGVPDARLFDEILKLLMAGQAHVSFRILQKYKLLPHLFPQTSAVLEGEFSERTAQMLNQGLLNTDQRIANEMPVTPAFLFAVMLWEPVRAQAEINRDEKGMPAIPAIQRAASRVLSSQAQVIPIHKRYTIMMNEIWSLQPRFLNRRGKRPNRLFAHQRFRAAYDFLLLRAQCGEIEQEVAQWWTDYQLTHPDVHKHQPNTRTRRRSRRPRTRNSGQS
ncbi:MAG TPA: polynucleotide adenylyltransferase PcnB [Gammaproteobacteria bacterium]|nr:polynucleotide adenylyltransferase PcnB [Gammaproteobacteria bacterium]